MPVWYRRDQDFLGRFLEDCCTIDPTAKTKAADLYLAFQGWSVANGDTSAKQRTFALRLKERGLSNAARDGVGLVVWTGVRLNAAGTAFRDAQTTGRLVPVPVPIRLHRLRLAVPSTEDPEEPDHA